VEAGGVSCCRAHCSAGRPGNMEGRNRSGLCFEYGRAVVCLLSSSPITGNFLRLGLALVLPEFKRGYLPLVPTGTWPADITCSLNASAT